jgi:AcrR family transcriptional regulator
VPRTDRRPRQRLDAETRRAGILSAAADAFTAQPYDKVSVARIAAAAHASEALVHRYFAGKTGLYLAVSRAGIGALISRQEEAIAAAPADTRARLAATVGVYLDTVAEWSHGWLNPFRPTGGEPAEALDLRRETRETYAALLRDLLGLPDDPGLDYAVHGYLSFLDAACLRWAERNYPPGDRQPLTEQAIAALTGALLAAGHPTTLYPGLDALRGVHPDRERRPGACVPP